MYWKLQVLDRHQICPNFRLRRALKGFDRLNNSIILTQIKANLLIFFASKTSPLSNDHRHLHTIDRGGFGTNFTQNSPKICLRRAIYLELWILNFAGGNFHPPSAKSWLRLWFLPQRYPFWNTISAEFQEVFKMSCRNFLNGLEFYLPLILHIVNNNYNQYNRW